MSRDIDLRGVAARLVRQSLDMGETEWFLDGLDRERVLALLRAAERAPGPSASAAGPAGSAGIPEAPAPPAAQPDDGRRGERGPARTGAPSLTDLVRAEIEGSSSRPRPGAAGTEAAGATDAGAARVAGDDPGRTATAGSKPTGTTDLPVLPDDHDGLRDLALGCTRCGLSGSRTQVVFSDGAPDARLMVVGEAPGANEDETGLPFVGAAGKFLDLLLATVDLSREESVYICNVLKCRPPGNRNPEPREIETCSPYLLKQIEIVRPRAILAVGSFSAQLLTGRDKTALGKLRGEVHSYQGVPLVVTYHPAALLRNANWTRAFWDDLQLLRDVIDEAG